MPQTSIERHEPIFPARAWPMSICVVGCGGIGSAILRQLGKMQVGHNCEITVFDDDIVEPHNPPNQAFMPWDVGKLKVEVAAERYRAWSDGATIIPVNARVGPGSKLTGVVFVCVDDMHQRRVIFGNCLFDNKAVCLVIETRMNIENARVLTLDPNFEPHQKAWQGEWYPSEQVVRGEGCDGHETVIAAVEFTASMAVQQLINWLKADFAVEKIHNDVAINLREWQVWRYIWPIEVD